MQRKVYFDNVSTTSIHPEVLKTYKNLLDEYYCNSDALYDDGVAIYRMQEDAREKIASLLHVAKEEIIFTSGASEANSSAVKGLALLEKEKKHIITSIYEHSSLYNACVQVENLLDYEVTYLEPGADGRINPEDVRNALREDTLLVSIMYVNNELGVINDIDTIKKIVKRESGAFFHSDITQAVGKIDIDLKDIDLASFSAHKIHGLKGSGILVKKRHVPMVPLISGGQQEFALRGGTSNALVNIMMAKTLRLALEDQKKNEAYIRELCDYFKESVLKINGITINSPEGSIYNLINLSTPLTSEVMMNALNLKGIMVSSKSTCGSRENEPSRVLAAMDIDDEYAIRVSFDEHNTKEEIDYFIEQLKGIIKRYG